MRISSLVPLRLRLYGWHKVNLLKHLILGRNVRAVLIDSRNGTLLIDVRDRTIGSVLANAGEYGWDEIERIRSYCAPEDDVLVVGAHVGSIAIPVAKFSRSVTAIEANPSTFRLLELNLQINNCPNVQPINIAASDKEEELQFLANRVNSGGSKRVPLVRDFRYFSDRPSILTIRAAPLDQVMSGLAPAVILMDIEGSEYFALRGMQRLLNTAKVLFLEFIPHHLRNVAGVSVAELMSSIAPHFSYLAIPSKRLRVSSDGFLPVLQKMYDADESDESIIFSK